MQLLSNFSMFYGTQSLLPCSHSLQLSLSWTRSVQSMPAHPISPRSILLLSTHLCLNLPIPIPKSYMHSSFLHLCYMPCPFSSPWFVHSDFSWQSIQVMKLLIMQLSPTSRHFISPWSKCSQHPFSFTPMQNQRQIIVLYTIIIMF
jgi:hypothetical protein